MPERFVRIGPVHFQTLEQELEPVSAFLTGHFLNAGCGTRDLSAFLQRCGVTATTRYDKHSDDPQVVLGPLEAMPFPDGAFDSVLCNAVLEHVADPEAAMEELARVTKPGGHIVVAVPFLQPFHACPGDYQRYTGDGLAELGRRARLDVVVMLPVHSIGQTVGWILWEYATEKGGKLRRRFIWLLVYLLTRFNYRTDTTLVRNANTLQAVFRKSPDLPDAEKGWRSQSVPAASAQVPTMLVPDELRLLHYFAEVLYTGEGAIIDAGSFLGGSTVALADGLRNNLRRRGARMEKLIHAFDKFEVEEWTRGVFFPTETPAGESFRTRFDANIARYARLIEVHEGDALSLEWNRGPIEILFIDIAKHWKVCDRVTWTFFPHLIPGRSLVIQQDYLYHHWVAWLHVTMEFYSDYFEYVCDTDVNSVVFLYTKKIPDDVLRRHTVESLTLAEKEELMDRAASRFHGPKHDMMVAAKAHFLEMLAAS